MSLAKITKKITSFFKITESDGELLLKQKYIGLNASFQKYKFRHYQDDQKKDLIDATHKLFEQTQSWDSADTIEQYLIDLLEDEKVELDLNLKLIKAKVRLEEDTYNFYKNATEGETVSDRRHLLSRLVKDLQVSHDYENLIRDYSRLIRVRTNLLFIFSLVAFFMVDQMPSMTQNVFNIEKGDLGDAILTAMTAGWIGASFSILIGLKKRISSGTASDLQVMHKLEYIFSRIFIGTIAGLILFYFFQSGILSGDFFPKLRETAPYLDSKDNALLIVWSFIAGFSEKLVPDILNKTGNKANQ